MKKVLQFLSALCLFFAMISCSQSSKNIQAPKSTLDILVGTYTGQGSEGIYRLEFDIFKGTLENKGLVVQATNPSFLAISKDRQKVFAVNETENGNVSSFKWNMERTSLELISQVPTNGDYPCYVELNSAESSVAIANYMTGNVGVYDLDKNGTIETDPYFGQHEGVGPNEARQEGPHAHCVRFSPKSKYMYAVDLGIDEVVKYSVIEDSISEPQTALKLEPGDGPRHLIFHPTQDIAYVISELSSTVVAAKVDRESGDLTVFDRVSTLPEGYEGESYCADIHISDDGKFLYASNRGHNSIAVFSLEGGQMNLLETQNVKGDWPRNFALSPDANNSFLLVANQKSDNIVVFKRNTESGLLTYNDNQIEISQPVCLKF